LGLGLLWLSFVHCFPRIAPRLGFILAILTLIALGIVVLVTGSKYLAYDLAFTTITMDGS
jgi:hypothetical protein